jgi:hypothetical protein
VKPAFAGFVRDHARTPLPDTLTWQRGEDDPFVRAHWLIVDRLNGRDERSLPDVNVIPMPPTREFGLMTIGTRIRTVLAGSNAADIGLRAGDVLLRINDDAVPRGTDFDQMLDRCCQPGARLRMTVSRNNQPIELTGIYQPAPIGDRTLRMFPPRRPSGRVDLVKTGNTVRATTSGVAEYTLLLSPDAFDFARPVTVVTNGKPSFEGRVEKSLATLLKWAAADNDRTMLFGAELHVTVD